MQVNPCERRPCQNGGLCSPLSESEYACRCPPGFEGRDCERRECCAVMSLFYLLLLLFFRTFAWNCWAFWQILLYKFAGAQSDPCLPNPCRNRAECQPAGNQYRCICRNGYEGNFCEISRFYIDVNSGFSLKTRIKNKGKNFGVNV